MRAVIAAALALVPVVPTVALADDTAEITHVIKHTWEKPDAIIRVAPVSVEGGYAVAGWIQGERGGRALLQKGDKWRVVLCSGDGIRSVEGLRAAGVPDALSAALDAKVASAEAALLPADVAKFALFEGSVPVTDDGHAEHHHQHQSKE